LHFFAAHCPAPDNTKCLLPQGVAKQSGSHKEKSIVPLPLPLLHGGGRKDKRKLLGAIPQTEGTR